MASHLINREMQMDTKQVAAMLKEFLTAFGFDAMAAECGEERDVQMLKRYARIVLKQTPEATRRNVFNRFALLGLV